MYCVQLYGLHVSSCDVIWSPPEHGVTTAWSTGHPAGHTSWGPLVVSRLLTPCSGEDHITPQDSKAYALRRCKIMAVSYVLPSFHLWCPPSNLFTSNKVSSSTRCAWYVRHSQDFLPRAQHMYEKYFCDAKSWPLCCINLNPAPAPSAIALLHRKWLKRTHEVLNFWYSDIRNQRSHIFKLLYITKLSYKRKLHNSRASAIKVWRTITFQVLNWEWHIVQLAAITVNTHTELPEVVPERVRWRPDQAIYIFQLRSTKTSRTAALLSAKFGITPKAICDIWTQRSWADDTRPFWTLLDV